MGSARGHRRCDGAVDSEKAEVGDDVDGGADRVDDDDEVKLAGELVELRSPSICPGNGLRHEAAVIGARPVIPIM